MPSRRLPADHPLADEALPGRLPTAKPRRRFRQAALEVGLVFAIFFIQGATPAPDVNEPYYVGKAVHYWNPDWIAGDFFLETPDAHKVFYFLFGWPGRWVEPEVLAWTGRVITWLLLAWAWCQVSRALIGLGWLSLLSAMLFVLLQEHGQMAGEWVIGGVEGKGFAYVFVLLGIAAVLRDQWASAWVMFGAAAAFHVLVGGWAAVAAGLAWLMQGRERRKLTTMAPGLVLGALLALPGLIPALMLDWGVDPGLRSQAHQIYVFQRLSHHLVPYTWPMAGMLWFAGLVLVWMVLDRLAFGPRRPEIAGDFGELFDYVLLTAALKPTGAWRRLRAFVNGSLIIFTAGLGVALLEPVSPAWAAAGLRFYWFRLADVMLPLGVALGGTLAIAALALRTLTLMLGVSLADKAAKMARILREHGDLVDELKLQQTIQGIKLLAGWLVCGLILIWCVVNLGGRFFRLMVPHPPPAYRQSGKSEDFLAWRTACCWIADSGRIAPEARFLTPRMNQTFKWYARRAEVVNRKDVPQDAASLVEWWERLCTIHATGKPAPFDAWYNCLEELGTERLRQLGRRYGATYVISRRRRQDRPPDLPVVYRNRSYVIYRLD